MYQVAVEWGTAGLTLFALLSALLQSWASTSLAAVRLLDLIYLFQVIVSIGLLNLNYPVVYRSFALNFAWAGQQYSLSLAGILFPCPAAA